MFVDKIKRILILQDYLLAYTHFHQFPWPGLSGTEKSYLRALYLQKITNGMLEEIPVNLYKYMFIEKF